ncbi:hypothetical protein [Streptomyces sp. SM10]|uniref:hypothetical protein n=1 Tax=Streptomyces sp. SM10 TaxID=565556 RepID=UPI0015E18EAB|nr:hypothetical protein [Streptomyces sp. SM10]
MSGLLTVPPVISPRDRVFLAAGAAAPGAGAVLDCLLTGHPGLPRDRMGHRLNASGRSLIIDAVHSVHGLRVNGRDLARDAHRRWRLPRLGLAVSVAHCAEFSAVAFGTGAEVGVDLQDERDRPGAMGWLGALLGLPGPACIRDFAECEALIKASHLTKETFRGVRLPEWSPGWRPTGVAGHQVRSAAVGRDTYLALAADRTAPVRWWWRPDPGTAAARTDAPTLESA